MRLPFIAKLIFNRYFFEKFAAIALLGLILYVFEAFFLIFLFAFLFAYLFLDLAKWLQGKITSFTYGLQILSLKKFLVIINRLPVLVTMVYLIFIAVISGMFYSLIPQLIDETRELIMVAPQITSQLQSAAESLQRQIPFDLGLDEAFATLVSQANIEYTLKNVFENIKSASIFLFEIVIALALSYVFIMDRAKIDEYIGGMRQGNFSFLYEEFALIFEKISKGFGLIFKAQAIIALVNALLTVAWLLLISTIHGGEVFPFIATIGVIVFVFGFVPVLGFLLSSLPILLIGFNYGGETVVIAVLVMIVVVHSVEAYFLNPKIVSSYMEFPVFVTFLILLVSEHFLGFIGLLVGVPLFYILLDVMKDFDKYVDKIRKISHTIDTQKLTTKEAIHKNIRLSRSGKRASE